MDDALLVGVLHGFADSSEELEASVEVKFLVVGESRDRGPVDKFHHEEGPSVIGRAGFEYSRDIRMLHHCERLAFGLEALDNADRIHAEFDEFQGNEAADGRGLFGKVDAAAAPFADFSLERVGADGLADEFLVS